MRAHSSRQAKGLMNLNLQATWILLCSSWIPLVQFVHQCMRNCAALCLYGGNAYMTFYSDFSLFHTLIPIKMEILENISISCILMHPLSLSLPPSLSALHLNLRCDNAEVSNVHTKSFKCNCFNFNSFFLHFEHATAIAFLFYMRKVQLHIAHQTWNKCCAVSRFLSI